MDSKQLYATIKYLNPRYGGNGTVVMDVVYHTVPVGTELEFTESCITWATRGFFVQDGVFLAPGAILSINRTNKLGYPVTPSGDRKEK